MTLPTGWINSKIGDVCDLANGMAFKPTDWAKTGLPIIRIQNLNQPDAKFNYCDRTVDDRFLVENGELLFAWSGTPGTSFGAHVWSGGRAVLNQHIFRMRFNPDVLNKTFFKFAINAKLEELIGKAHGGVGLRHVTKGKFEETEIGVPPLAEQRRIVAKLDTLTARLTRARTELDRVAAMAKEMRTAVRRHAFDAALAFANANACPVSDYCLSITDGDHQAPPKSPEGVPFITISAMNSGAIDLRKASRFVPPSYFDSLKASRQPQPGDVLYSVTGSFGIPAIVTTDDRFVFQRHIAILRPKPDACQPHWLWFMLGAPQAFEQASAVATGTAQMTVPLTGLRSLNLPKIGLEEQARQTQMLETAFARADRLEAEAVRARALLDRLEAAILARAFRGELVPQDPTDEPASVLLDRIRAERAAAPTARRGRRSTPAGAIAA